MPPSLATVVARQPYPDYQEWWQLGEELLAMMSEAVVAEWQDLSGDPEDIGPVQQAASEYVSLAYRRQTRPGLAADFVQRRRLDSFRSGEFDALSYAFYRCAFDLLARRRGPEALARARRRFTERVGARFFARLAGHLGLEPPSNLSGPGELALLEDAIAGVGSFLLEQGYLRSHFAFRFDVKSVPAAPQIDQEAAEALQKLAAGETVYALYEMGHPVILPSAVYLYQTVGEAQHHSSRTIEELFARAGCRARETDDFDPGDYRSDLVVELWKIRRLRSSRPARRAGVHACL